MYCEQRIYNNVHICIVNREYTTMFIYVFRTENIQQCTYMYCEQRIYKHNVNIYVHIVLRTENIQQCTYMY